MFQSVAVYDRSAPMAESYAAQAAMRRSDRNPLTGYDLLDVGPWPFFVGWQVVQPVTAMGCEAFLVRTTEQDPGTGAEVYRFRRMTGEKRCGAG
ncbi:hypothetical protein BV898_19814 [Hypsibius exemplaris]|uniref:Uncharacterized protein n=1 Tax=Hypsibius exemplaris TaxID=2072580 RepID=A0A9X6NKB9_HYPEX|nr:hypothetical protein BV898_19814 [Hypsibius exemplaris]